MINYLLMASAALLFLSFFIGIFRMARGPTILDRILGFDAMSVALVGIIILIMVRESTPYYVEILLLFSLIGFTSTVAFMEYQFDKEEKG